MKEIPPHTLKEMKEIISIVAWVKSQWVPGMTQAHLKQPGSYYWNYTEPPPELVEGEEVYEVETILSHRRRGRGYQYFIKWWGYPISDALWEPEHVFSDDGDILRQ